MKNHNNMPDVRNSENKGEVKKAFNNLFGSFKYMFQSAAGKRSLDSYLETISEFADETIIESENEGLNYIGGECFMKSNSQNSSQILATIELQFQTAEGNWKKKQAQRVLEKSTFTTEAINQIGDGEGLTFNIEPPVQK